MNTDWHGPPLWCSTGCGVGVWLLLSGNASYWLVLAWGVAWAIVGLVVGLVTGKVELWSSSVTVGGVVAIAGWTGANGHEMFGRYFVFGTGLLLAASELARQKHRNERFRLSVAAVMLMLVAAQIGRP